MTKLSLKKVSILGLVLVAASAVTAAVLPKKDVKKNTVAGKFIPTSAGDGKNNGTCSENAVGTINCSATADSITSFGNGTISSSTNFAGDSSTGVNTTV